RGGIDLMVAMNPQTWGEDVRGIEPGGYLFYDSTKPMPPSAFRDDINVIGVPLTQITNTAYTDARQRQLFNNIMYVGALAYLLGIEPAVIETLLREEFASKPKLIDANLHAFEMGHAYAREHFKPIGLQVTRTDKVGNKIFIEGNAAAGLGAVYGGA